MVTTEAHAPGGTTFIQRWLARLAFAAIAAALLVPPLAAGVTLSLALLVVAVAGLIVTSAAVWWALTYRGLVRWLAVVLAVAVPLGLLALFMSYGLVQYVALQFGLLALAVVAGRAALRREAIPERLREHPAPPPRRPFLIMNPRSGGGKVVRFGLKEKAEARGATVVVLEGPGPPRRQGRDHPGPAAWAAGRPSGPAVGGQGREGECGGAAGGAGLQQRLWDG